MATKEEAPKEPGKQPGEDQSKEPITPKVAIKAACDELHAVRPQPRGPEIELVLDQIKQDPPKSEEAARAKAKELLAKVA
jgi:hypothetical protein